MRWLLCLFVAVSVSAAYAGENAAPPAADAAVASTENSTAAASTEAAAVVATDAPKTDNRKESEIPLNLEGKKNAAAESSSLFRILMTLSVLGVVGTGAFIFLRKYSIPKASKHQTQIKVLQQHYLGPKKSLAIVRVAGESILIGVTDHNISMIKSLSLLDDEVPEEAPGNFTKVLGDKGISFADKNDEQQDEEEETPRRSSGRRTSSSRELDADEEFAISGIKDIVSKRLKGMRSFQ